MSSDRKPEARVGATGHEPDALAGAVIDEDDRHFKRRLGWPSLAALTFTAMVGSGWLFASYYAGSMAGPAALVSWVIAAITTTLVALTYIELGVTRPIAGGTTRWPAMLAGPFVGIMTGWVVMLQTALSLPSEAAGLLQYASHWWPGLVAGKKLSAVGLVVAAALLIVLTLINAAGVTVLTRISNAVTAFKIGVPVLTIVLMLASGFDTRNVATGHGFAPFGSGAILSAVIGAGLIYSFAGVYVPAIMAGETSNPRRNIPLGTFVGFAAAFLMYILLQFTYLWTVPNRLLAEHGWGGLNFDSPFAQLAGLLNLGWLTQVLLVDALVSPAGSLMLGLGTGARQTYGIAQNRTLPKWVARVNERTGIPNRALALNLAVSLVFLVVFQSWQGLVSSLGFFFAIGYAVIAVAAGVNSADPRLRTEPWMRRGMSVIAPASFVVAGLILYWAGWSQVWLAVLLFAVCLPIGTVAMLRDRRIFTPALLLRGAWMFVFMLFMLVASKLGSFGGDDVVHAPWDSVLVGIGSLAFYRWGRRECLAWLRSPAAEEAAGMYY